MRDFGKNIAKAKLQADELVLCLCVNQMRTPNIAMLAASAGFDALYVDHEHNPTDLETTAAICIAAVGMGITPLVRIASVASHDIGRVLDLGAQGIMVAHVNTAEEARAVAAACLFKPLGHRSASGPLVSMAYRPLPQAEVNAMANRETLVMAIIETEEGLANVDAIGAVPGIDTLHIGANDLSIELGVTGQYRHATMRDAYAKVTAAARKGGKSTGIGGIRNDPALQTELLQQGFRYITCGSDVGYVLGGGQADTEAIRAMPLK